MPGAAFPQRAHALGEASLLAKTRFRLSAQFHALTFENSKSVAPGRGSEPGAFPQRGLNARG